MFADEPQKGTILYVEDDANNRTLVRRVLMAEGYEIVEASSANEALAVVRNNLKPDLILMDINMPEMDGYTLTTRLKEFEHLKKVPIIAVTANVMRGDREKSLQAGCDGYIQKPIDIDLLTQQIEHFIKR